MHFRIGSWLFGMHKMLNLAVTGERNDFHNINVNGENVTCGWCQASIGRINGFYPALVIVRRYRLLRIDPMTITSSCRMTKNSTGSDSHSHALVIASIESDSHDPLVHNVLRRRENLLGEIICSKCERVLKFFGITEQPEDDMMGLLYLMPNKTLFKRIYF